MWHNVPCDSDPSQSEPCMWSPAMLTTHWQLLGSARQCDIRRHTGLHLHTEQTNVRHGPNFQLFALVVALARLWAAAAGALFDSRS